jgi:nicotinate-nucleotide adenylyltransferase
VRLGIFGGTFDPIHRGHLSMARSAVERFRLDRLLLVPAPQPPHKPDREITAWRHRYAMAVLASQDLDRVEVSDVEGSRPGPSFTVETLEHFRHQVGPQAGLFFLMGSDSLAELPLWKDHTRILDLAHVVVAPRPGIDRNEALSSLGPEMAAHVVEDGGPGGRPAGGIFWLDWEPVDISGSEIRLRLAAGEELEDVVPAPVAAYISKYRVYPVSRSSEA